MSMSPSVLRMLWGAHRELRKSHLLDDHAALMALWDRKDKESDTNPDIVSRSKESNMHFYVVMRRETGSYIGHKDTETEFVSMAVRYSTRKRALEAAGPNTCVCGPYPTDDYEGKPT